jgi:beta-phosphoglucomutase family hydrolase
MKADLVAALLDLDGVVTDTAAVHAAAWKALFDRFLAARSGGGTFEPFRLPEDYVAHVDGKPRQEGVRDFLHARGIALPEGDADDPPGHTSLWALGNAKNLLFNEILEREGVVVFAGALRLLEALRARGVRTACVSSSRNARPVLARAGLMQLFDTVVDGTDLAAERLPGKPAPDSFLAAAARLGAAPQETAVIEDATAGVAAGRAGGFALVVGVDRGAGPDALLAAGADLVVEDPGELLAGPAAVRLLGEG